MEVFPNCKFNGIIFYIFTKNVFIIYSLHDGQIKDILNFVILYFQMFVWIHRSKHFYHIITELLLLSVAIHYDMNRS